MSNYGESRTPPGAALFVKENHASDTRFNKTGQREASPTEEALRTDASGSFCCCAMHTKGCIIEKTNFFPKIVTFGRRMPCIEMKGSTESRGVNGNG